MFLFPRNEGLVQRQALDQLAKILSMAETYQSAAIWGLGGCGWADFLHENRIQQLTVQQENSDCPGIRIPSTKFYFMLGFLGSRGHRSLVFA
jgi:hypothetical protein